MKETVEQFLERGGQVTVCEPYVPSSRNRMTHYDRKVLAKKLALSGQYEEAKYILRKMG